MEKEERLNIQDDHQQQEEQHPQEKFDLMVNEGLWVGMRYIS